MTWGHDVPVSAVSGPPSKTSRLASADMSGVVCLWHEDGAGARSCINVFGKGAGGAPIVSLTTLLELLLCGHKGGVVGLGIQENQELCITFSIPMQSGMGEILAVPNDTSVWLISVTEEGAMLHWDVCQGPQGYMVNGTSPKELCGKSLDVRGGALVAVGTETLCWLAPESSGKGLVVRWLDVEDPTQYPKAFEAIFNWEPAVSLHAIAVFPEFHWSPLSRLGPMQRLMSESSSSSEFSIRRKASPF